MIRGMLAVTTLRVFRLHLSVLFPCEWWGRKFLNHSNIEAVLIKRQPGDSLRKTKQVLDQFGFSVLITPSVNLVKNTASLTTRRF